MFTQKGYNNIKLIHAKAEKFDSFINKRFDLVFSWACLMYISSNKIEKVLSKILRVAKRRILLAEFHDPKLKKTKWDNHWVYNYENLFNKYNDKIESISIIKISEMDHSEIWKKYGYYIDVRLKDRK